MNMMDTCRELFSFFDYSAKRQNFFAIVVHPLSPDSKMTKLKNMCKPRWIERHTAFETIFELYEYIVITLNEICHPTTDDRFYTTVKEWQWDTETKTKANGPEHVMRSFGHKVNFVVAKNLLEPMRPLVASLQGRLVEVYFGFQKVAEVKRSYADIRNNIDDRFDQIYREALRLAEQVGSIEQRPRLCGLQRFRNNTPESIHTYWKRSVAIPFLDVVCNEIAACSTMIREPILNAVLLLLR